MGTEADDQDLGTSSQDTSGAQPEIDAPETDAAPAEGTEGGDTGAEPGGEAAGGESEASEGDGAAEGTEEGDGEAADPSAGAWAPDTARFKVDGKELEYDPKIRAVLTKENEPIIRELQEKAHGIEAIKIRHEEVKGERDGLKGQLGNFVGNVREILAHRDAGDFDSFLEACNIPFDKMATWMHQKLTREANLSPEQRAVYDEASRSRKELQNSTKQFEELRAANENAMAQVGAMKLETELADPGVAEAARQFDARSGKPGSFRRAVIEHAASRELMTRQSIEPNEAVQGFLALIGHVPGKPAAATATAKPKVVTAHKPATIPNVGASAKTPVKTQVKNLNDLRRIAKEKGV